MAQSIKLCDRIKEKEAKNEIFFSFEYFPPRTDRGVQNLYMRLEAMSQYKPMFVDVTWGAGGSTSDLTPQICKAAFKYYNLEANMHLTCTNMEKQKIDDALQDLRDTGLRNVLALRGDPPRGEEWKQVEGGFANASDLVRYIRQKHGDWFCISVAGYPEKHVDCTTYEQDLQNLKGKVDAGADVIMTQLFYDAKIFFKFVKDCRDIGINVPILPGLMPIRSYSGLIRMTSLCGSTIPDKILTDIEPFKEDDEAVSQYGVDQCVEMCKELMAGGVKGLHFYTLNMEISVRNILLKLGLITPQSLQRELPWSVPRLGRKGSIEAVRPIFWANRPKSFIARTYDWDAFPNGRWGDAESPAFETLGTYHTHRIYCNSVETRKTEWGAPKDEQAIIKVFVDYLEGKIMRLPWNDTPLAPESGLISNPLKTLNKAGFLTINSQPSVNAAPSTDKVYGWGAEGGYVYQKAYIEFFTSAANLEKLLALFPNYPTLSYQAVNLSGKQHGNLSGTAAVTWGVWPRSEIKQPTVVDPSVFLNIWKDEAFALWDSQWGALFPEDDDTRKVIQGVAKSYFLVNIIEDNFINGNIFSIFEEALNEKF